MDELRTQIARAQRRLSLETLRCVLSRSLFAALVLVVMGLAVPKLWAVDLDSAVWTRAWILGGVAIGLLVGGLWAWRKSASSIDAAIEIDRRFGLKERVSSALALAPQDIETEAGQALVNDASRRIRRIDVSEQFALEVRPWDLLPLLPAIAAFVLVAFVPNAKREAEADTSTLEVKQIQRTVEGLQKRMAERRKQAEAQDGLEDASELFAELEKRAADLAKAGNRDRKKALAKLNNLADEIRRRRAELGDRDGLNKQLARFGNMKQGPADKVARAIKNGEFGKAMEAMKKLQAQMQSGELSEQQRKQLGEQLKQMAEKMSQMAEAHQMSKNELQKQIERLKQAGDFAKAGQLQNQLERMNMQSPQMSQMGKLAEQLANCAQAASQGKSSDAASQMESIVQSLEQMQMEIDQLQMMEDALSELASAKSALTCDSCGGMGCMMCQGGMGGLLDSVRPGMGMGQGQGVGDRPEAETGSQFYDSRVPGEIRRGKAVITGSVGGPNRTGDTLEEVKQAIANDDADADDPLTGVRLPRAQRKHAQQYFDRLREGQE